jgi:hypothetical protein
MENPYEVEEVRDQKFIYDIFYEKTKPNRLVVDVIKEFVRNRDYANLREKCVPEIYQMHKNYVLLIIVPKAVKAGYPCYNYRRKSRMERPYVLISVNIEALGNVEVLRFHGVFNLLSSAIVHEMLHELYYDEAKVERRLSKYIEQLNKQLKKDEKKFLALSDLL